MYQVMLQMSNVICPEAGVCLGSFLDLVWHSDVTEGTLEQEGIVLACYCWLSLVKAKRIANRLGRRQWKAFKAGMTNSIMKQMR